MAKKITKEITIPLEWKQHDSKVRIEVLEFTKDTSINLSNLLNELSSKNVSFSIKLDQENQYLIFYNSLIKEVDMDRRKELIRYLKETYSMKDSKNPQSIFLPRIKKITEQEDSILKLKLVDNSNQFFFVCMLSSIDAEVKDLRKKITPFVMNLLQAGIFSVVISNIPSYRKGGEIKPMWGLMLYSESKNLNDVVEKKKQFLRYLQNKTIKLNCKLSSISKRAITRHEINFRFFVPWIKHEGSFSEIIGIEQIIDVKNRRQRRIKSEKPNDIPPYSPIKNLSQKSDLKSISMFKPFPSAKELSEGTKVSGAEIVSEPSSLNPLLDVNNNIKIPAPSNLDDLTLPIPRTVHTTFDAEYLKVRINKVFKEFDFKETVIFEDSFDLVLRKQSFYVFVKFYQDILNQANAYEIVDILSSIAGLRNDFLCIVVADVVEEGSKNVLHEYNVLHLTLNDVLLNDALKAKIYNTILA